MNNTCICCGEIIPEGRLACPNCEKNVFCKKCKSCRWHKENTCLINIGLWKDDDYCSQWKSKND